jgi:hypothetical protein
LKPRQPPAHLEKGKKEGAMIWKINFVVFNFIPFDSSSKVCVTV